MKICMVGDFSENFDEGLKNIANSMSNTFPEQYEIIKLNIKKVFHHEFWIEFRKSCPDIIHYIPGPTIFSFLVVKILKVISKTNPKIIMSAPQPRIPSFFNKLLSVLKPDLILVQSLESEKRFKNMGWSVDYLPNGVNTNKFFNVSYDIKKKLRKKYAIDENKFVVLHVGHIMNRRNIRFLNKIQKAGNQVIVVASEYLKFDAELYKNLVNNGCIVFKGYFENIEEFYQLSDCYVFPVKPDLTIETPLSVLEAMSCNILVITSKFRGLTRMFEPGDGLIFVDDEDEIIKKIEMVKKNYFSDVKTREKVLPFSWENINSRLIQIYEKVLVEENE